MMINPSQNLSQNPSTCPTWKLYENPSYKSHFHQQQDHIPFYSDQTRIHRLYLPISSHKIAASFSDLKFIRPLTESEQLDSARAEMDELKEELERERKARRKLELANKRLVKDLNAERGGREALQLVCEELAKEITSDKENLSRVKREIEEERKMLHVAEVLREQRVQMKLMDAKILMEEKLAELESFKVPEIDDTRLKFKRGTRANSGDDDGNCGIVSSVEINKRVGGSIEVENPHIKRGIKGFVEFPRVVKAIGSKSRRLGTKLECQKAQLMILLKNRSFIRSNNLIMS